MDIRSFAEFIENYLNKPSGMSFDVIGDEFQKDGDGFEISVWLDSSFEKAPFDLQEEYLEEFKSAWKDGVLGYRYDFLGEYDESKDDRLENPDSMTANLSKAIEMWKDRFVELYSCYLEVVVSPVSESRCGVSMRKYWIDNAGFETEDFEKTADADLSEINDEDDAGRWMLRSFGRELNKKEDSRQLMLPGFEASRRTSRRKIASRLIKMAKRLLAGGGAGIRFKINEFSGFIKPFRISGNADKWNESSLPDIMKSMVIDSFDAIGYQDGMENVSGEVVFSKVEADRNEIYDAIMGMISDNISDETFAEALKKGEVNVEINPEKSSESIMFGGYARGSLKKGDVIDFKHQFEVVLDWNHYFDTQSFDFTIYGTLSEKGEYWYEDVFEYIPKDDEDYESHWNDVRYEYGL